MGCILLGWVCTLSCLSLRLCWASLSSCMAYLLWTPMCLRKHIQTLQTYVCLSKLYCNIIGLSFTADFDTPLYFSQETCDDNLNITMCPLCDEVCDYWRLNTVCSLARTSYLFDNGATVLFAIFMSLWGNNIFKYFSLIMTHQTQ